MSAFEDIRLSWKGDTYMIPADRVMGAINRIEDHITLPEIHQMASRGGAFKFSRIASAYASVLRHAGCKVTDEEVYLGMVTAGAKEPVMEALQGLMLMMVPLNAGAAPVGKPVRRAGAVSGSSKKPTRRRSASAG